MLVSNMTTEHMLRVATVNAGLAFVNQLIVDDDERPATLVAVSSKWVYASETLRLY